MATKAELTKELRRIASRDNIEDKKIMPPGAKSFRAGAAQFYHERLRELDPNNRLLLLSVAEHHMSIRAANRRTTMELAKQLNVSINDLRPDGGSFRKGSTQFYQNKVRELERQAAEREEKNRFVEGQRRDIVTDFPA